MSKILNKESGLLGISGVSSDDRDVCAAEADGNMRAHLAHEMLYYQIAKYIGSYYVALGGCDGIVFTAGIGENQPMLREKVCDYLECLGVKLDKEFNKQATCGVTGTLSLLIRQSELNSLQPTKKWLSQEIQEPLLRHFN